MLKKAKFIFNIQNKLKGNLLGDEFEKKLRLNKLKTNLLLRDDLEKELRMNLLKYNNEQNIADCIEKIDSLKLRPSTQIINFVLRHYINKGMIEKAYEYYNRLNCRHFYPKDKTFSLLISGFIKKDVNLYKEEIMLLIKDLSNKNKMDNYNASILLDFYLKVNHMEEARKIFELTEKKEAIYFNIFIEHYLKLDYPKKAKKYLKLMINSETPPDEYSFLSFLKYYIEKDDIKNMEKYVIKMLENKIAPNITFFSLFVKYFLKNKDNQTAESLCIIMQEYKVKPDIPFFISTFKSLGLKNDSKSIFGVLNFMDKIQIVPNVNIYTVLIAHFLRCKKPTSAFRLYRDMVHRNITPSKYTLNSIVMFCLKDGNIARANNYLSKMSILGIEKDYYMYYNIIKFYVHQGDNEKIEFYYNEMKEKIRIHKLDIFKLLLKAFRKDKEKFYYYLNESQNIKKKLETHSNESVPLKENDTN
jgi:pentatricopeptide repeat protein